MIIGDAQLGPIQRADGRADVVKRLLALLHEAKAPPKPPSVRSAPGAAGSLL